MTDTRVPPQRRRELGASIGPYRLESTLGRGGMGEVYRAYDERLERSVALKRVRPGVGDPERALRRFRREARAAARLRHPALVQVHDWLEVDGEAWLVMELVEGRSLRDIVQRGALSVRRTVEIARDLLEGLAVAHDAGLVHRDLKADNVMVTPGSSVGRGRGEQAKILDFGLAKSAVPDADETRVSVDGKIIGTLSAMAPEQVLGQAVDGRTDLFALGCLLHEMLTGLAPFVGASAGETLNRICTARQMPVDEHRPDVSPRLSRFVDNLLEKDPRRRPASAHEALDRLEALDTLDEVGDGGLDMATEGAGLEQPVDDHRSGPPGSADAQARSGARRWLPAALVAAFVVALLAWRYGVDDAAAPIYVAVPATTLHATTLHATALQETALQPTSLDADDQMAQAELAVGALHTALLQGLVARRGVVALEVPAADDENQDPRALARTLAADEVLLSRLDCGPRGCRATLRRVGGADGRVLWAHTFTADPTRLLDLGQATLGLLANAYPDAAPRAGAPALEVRPEDYETFLRLRQRFLRRDRGFAADSLLEELTRLGRSSPRFVAVPVLEAYVSLQRFETRREAADLERAGRAVERALALVPDDPQVLMLAVRAARLGGELDEAAALLDTVRRLEPGNMEAQFQRALLHEREGELDAARALAVEAAARWPAAPLQFNTGSLLARLGEVDAARAVIERGLERSPSSFDGRSRLAQLELVHGDLESAVTLYRGLVERSPEPTELNNLGTALMMLGRYDEAVGLFEHVVEQSPDSASAVLNLADVATLAGDAERASALYRRVLEQVASDPRPERLAAVEAQALAHLERPGEAIEVIQRALRAAPDHPWVAYQAALVYCLLGDRASALWHARRALDSGLEPRWLELEFFEPLWPGLGLAESGTMRVGAEPVTGSELKENLPASR